MFTVGEMLRNRADFSPHLEAVVYGDERITYRELNRRVNRLAHFMMELDVQKGDRIGILCSTNHPFATVLLAAAKLGAVAVPLNWRLSLEEIQQVMEHSEPKLLFFDEEFSETADELESCEFLERMVRVSIDQKLNPPFVQALLEYPDTEPDVQVDSEDQLALTYTSGTTGKPKGVITTHANFHAFGVAASLTLDVRRGDRFLISTPLFRTNGLSAMVNALLLGGTVVFMPDFHPVRVWEVVERERITHLLSLPGMLGYMLPAAMNGDWDTGSMREFICGGPVPEELIRQYSSLGFPIVQMYGASEVTGGITFWNPGMGISTCHSAGKRLLGEIKVVDPTSGGEVPPGEIGEILYRGPQVTPGYWKDPEETARAIRDGWFHTGDAGRLEEDGLLYVVDRCGDLIYCNEELVLPTEVEKVLAEMEGVAEVTVIGVKDPEKGEVPRAYVVREENSSLTEEDVLRYGRERLAEHQLTEVAFVDELPRNSLGLITKYILREQADRMKTVDVVE
ncbi:O-succinylbenzoic acid--CoA ligase [Desmospora sp. 8437]|nr:O-succinylbenzoic acid--CoA ligase [Desmospora sp. 8437]